MLSDNDIFNLSKEINSAFIQYNSWYKFGPGKEFYRKLESTQKDSAKKLEETKSYIAILMRHYSHFLQNKDDLMTLENIIKLTAELELGSYCDCSFDYEKRIVVIENNGIEFKIEY